MQNKLAIAIPTYNRPEILKFNLLQILDDLIKYDIPVYISDDSSNDDTRKVIEELKSKHTLFFYHKNEIQLGHDLNFVSTIRLPKEEYVWYLGDSIVIKEGAIKKILNIITTSNYDFISLNAESRDLNIEERVFDDGVELFDQLCWHLTMTGTTIYNIKNIYNSSDFDVSKYKNFPQLAFIFDTFAKKQSNLYWINDKVIYGNPNKRSYWSQNIFEVFINDFKNSLVNLGKGYPLRVIDKVIFEHSVKSKIFTFRTFVKYRLNGVFNYKIFKKHKNSLLKYTELNVFVLFGIAVLPVFFTKMFLKILGVKFI